MILRQGWRIVAGTAPCVYNVPLGAQQTAVPPLGMTPLSMPGWGDARLNAYLTWDKEPHGGGKLRWLLADAACAAATRLL